VVFFPIISSSGAPFPINLTIKDIQDQRFRETSEYMPTFSVCRCTDAPKDAWRGDIVVGKYSDHAFGRIMNCAMSDYPMIIKSISLLSTTDPDFSCFHRELVLESRTQRSRMSISPANCPRSILTSVPLASDEQLEVRTRAAT